MKVPTVHLNGTSGGVLLEQVTDVLAALRNARAAMVRAAPHGRDYCTQADNALYLAQNAHVETLKTVDNLLHEYEALGEAIVNQPSFKG